jgi:Cu-Zn family superoxide dismutase
MNTQDKIFYNKYKKYKNKYYYIKNLKGGENDKPKIKAIAFFDKEKIKGTVQFEENDDNVVKVKINLTGLDPNKNHGFHIHESGDLSNGCTSLCAHFNPYNQVHGGREEETRHVGDLGNIQADADGSVNLEFIDELIKLSGNDANIIGRGLIIHGDKDDCGKTDHKFSKTTGNSGNRIACSIIGYGSICN